MGKCVMKMKIVILRGFGGEVFSTGMDRLGEKIQKECKNVEVVVDGYESYLKHYIQIKDSDEPVVLIGHSFGALACYKIVSTLPNKEFPLVVTFDYSPYYSGLIAHLPNGVVPQNVKHALNFYQEVDPLVRGVRMRRSNDSEDGIMNYLTGFAHVEIDKAEILHTEVITAIKGI